VRAEFERLELALSEPFAIARGSRETTTNVVVRLTDSEGRAGVGAAAPSTRYGETPATVEAVLPRFLDAVESVGDPDARQEIERRLGETVRGNPAARAAVSIALCDLAATRLGVPLYRLWGLDPDAAPPTSYTIGLAAPERMGEKAAAAVDAGHDVLKVKVGTDDDEARVAAVRAAAPDAQLRVDANEAWTPKEAVARCGVLADHGVEFVEQPVSADDPDGLRYVTERVPLPVIADESCRDAGDVADLAGRVDGVNLKLTKCGGIRETRRAIHAARAAGLEVMLGCMVETNAAIAAACHLAPLVDYADLDGSLLLADDPYEGVDVDGGDLRLDALDRPGTGARLRE